MVGQPETTRYLAEMWVVRSAAAAISTSGQRSTRLATGWCSKPRLRRGEPVQRNDALHVAAQRHGRGLTGRMEWRDENAPKTQQCLPSRSNRQNSSRAAVTSPGTFPAASDRPSISTSRYGPEITSAARSVRVNVKTGSAVPALNSLRARRSSCRHRGPSCGRSCGTSSGRPVKPVRVASPCSGQFL